MGRKPLTGPELINFLETQPADHEERYRNDPMAATNARIAKVYVPAIMDLLFGPSPFMSLLKK